MNLIPNSTPELQEFLKKVALQTLPLLSLEYPVHLVHKVKADGDVQTQRELHPLFYGCYDWHSAVHSYWQLLRIKQYLPETEMDIQSQIEEELCRCFDNVEGIATETQYLKEHAGFERPYGLAWILYLCREFRLLSDEADCKRWAENFKALEVQAIDDICGWLPKLAFPIRGGLHNQTAYSLALIWDWAITAEREDALTLIKTVAMKWYGNDKNAPVAYEPSASDFLSPTLGTVSLMQRILETDDFLEWFESYLPDLESEVAKQWLRPVVVADEADGRLAHFAGLNLSRAWMLAELAEVLPEDYKARTIILESSKEHLDAGLKYTLSDAYMLSHWVPSFAVYALTLPKT